MKASFVPARTACFVLTLLLAALWSFVPTASSATTYAYNQSSSNDIVPSFSFTTSMTPAQLANLAPGTDITGIVTAFSFQPRNVPAQDSAGFPIGGSFGSAYFNVSSAPTVKIGTNASSQITSWTITEVVFASYPAIPNENPNDFYCTYSASTTNTGDALALASDHDAGFCPSSTITSSAGSFGASAVPPTLSKQFGAASILLHGTTKLTFTVQNPNGSALTGIGFSDVLPAGLLIGNPSGLTSSCGGVTVAVFGPPASITLSGGTLAASGSCGISVNITSNSSGFKTNTTSAIASNQTSNGAAATATIRVGIAPHDFNGNGMSDILWHHSSGDMATWLMSGTSAASTLDFGNVPTAW